jgi:hypothetical protein
LDKAAGKTPDQLIRELIPTLAERTGEDDAAIASAIEQLCQRGLITTGTDGTLEITPRGRPCSSKWKPANYSWTPSFDADVTRAGADHHRPGAQADHRRSQTRDHADHNDLGYPADGVNAVVRKSGLAGSPRPNRNLHTG